MQLPTHAGSVAHQERIVWQQIRVHDCLHWLAELQAFRCFPGCTASNLRTFWNFQVGCGFNFPTQFVSFAFESIILSYFGYLMPKDLACISLSTQEDNVLLQALCRHPNFRCIILYHHSRSYLQYLHRSTLDCWQPTSTHTHSTCKQAFLSSLNARSRLFCPPAITSLRSRPPWSVFHPW